jgi:hypothetical protein
MPSQCTLDVGCGDAIVIVTRAATLRVDCHRMDSDWSLLLQYRAEKQGLPPYTEQFPMHFGDGQRLQESPSEQLLPAKPESGRSDGIPGSAREVGESQPEEACDLADFGVIRKLGDLPPDAVISEDGLARLFGRHRASIKRAVGRGELPPSIRLFGEPVWTIEALRNHMNKRLAAADKEASQCQRRLSRIRP